MTCPCCGTIAADDAERCVRCGNLVAIPAVQVTTEVPVLRAATRRGELAQRAAGIIARPILPPSAPYDGFPSPAPATPPTPPAVSFPMPASPAPVGPAADVAPPAVPAAPAPAARPGWTPQPPPPPLATVAPSREATSVLPAVDGSARPEPARRDEAADETRARPAHDAPWPPPPARWTEHRPSES